MGMGEPLHNYDAVMKAVDILRDPEGMSPGRRPDHAQHRGRGPGHPPPRRGAPARCTWRSPSTPPPRRSAPPSCRWPDVAARRADGRLPRLQRADGRRIFYEWTLIEGRNDSAEHARAVGRLLGGCAAQVNLIPLNPTAGYDGSPGAAGERANNSRRSSPANSACPSTVRQRRGIDIAAGCGQLAGTR